MFLEIRNPRTGKRILFNTDTALAFIENDTPNAQAVSIAGHVMDLPLSIDLLKAGLEDDELETQHGERGYIKP
jgi:hypothetical protein